MPDIDDFLNTTKFPPVVDVAAVRAHLGLTKERLARLLETDVSTITKMEQPVGSSQRREPAARMERLLAAYLDGWRPEDWPKGGSDGAEV